jgi:uncharacterized protein DUF5367
MWLRTLVTGLVIWIAGTVGFRLSGHRLLRPGHDVQTVALYCISFVLMAFLVPRICRRLGLQKDLWPKAATLIILPTLILDPFSCAFFATIFPNLDPAAAGAFGGWMLICCGGAVAGVWRKL